MASSVLVLSSSDESDSSSATQPMDQPPPFRLVDHDVAQTLHAWQSPPSWDPIDDAANEAAADISEVYSQAEAWRDGVDAETLQQDSSLTDTGDRQTGDWSRVGAERRIVETRYSPGLSTFLDLDGHAGAENVRSALISMPPMSIEAAKALLDGASVRLYVGKWTSPRLVHIYEGGQGDSARLIDEPEDENQIDPLELVVPWLPPTLLLSMATAASGIDGIGEAATAQMYLGSHGGAGLVALPHGVRKHWRAWASALANPMHRVWRLAYLRFARVADRLNRPFCYQLVAPSWRHQYAMVMRMYTHVYVVLERPLTETFDQSDRFHALRHRNSFAVDAVVPCSSAVVGKYGLSLVVDTRSAPPTVNVSQTDAPLRRTLERMQDKRLIVRSVGALAFAVELRLVDTAAATTTDQQAVVIVQRLVAQFGGLVDYARANGLLLDNEIELHWALGGGAEPSMVRVGRAVRRAMGEPDERRYAEDMLLQTRGAGGTTTTTTSRTKQDIQRQDAIDRDVLSRSGRSRIQLYVVQHHDAYELAPIEKADKNEPLTALDQQRWIGAMHRHLRTRAVRQYVLAPKLCHPNAWSQTALQQAYWEEFDRYVTLRSIHEGTNAPELSGTLDVNRAITLRVVFEAEQMAHEDYRDTCVLRPVPSEGGETNSPDQRASPLRTSLLFIGNKSLRESLTNRVSAYLLPSLSVHSYMALYGNGLSNTPQDMSHARGMGVDTSTIDYYLGAALDGGDDPRSDLFGRYERTAALLTRATSDYDRPTLGPEKWGEQVPTPTSNTPSAPLYLDDDWLADDIEHVYPWPPAGDFVPSNAHMSRDRLVQELSMMGQVQRHVERAPNAAMYGMTSFYRDVRDTNKQLEDDQQRVIEKHVRFGVWLDGLHPRSDISQQNMRSAVLVHDPHYVLHRFGIDTLRVMVYVNYRSAITGERYTNAEPTVVTYALHTHTLTGRVVALPYTGDPVLHADDWFTTQPLMVHGSSVEVNSPGLMLSKKLAALRV